MSRRGYFVSTYNSVGHFISQVKSLYRTDIWVDSDVYCEVWVESRSIAAVVEELCEEYCVSLYPCGGFPSLSYVYDAVQGLQEASGSRPIHVFYIGDYDPAGLLINLNLEKEMRRHLPDSIDLTFHRVGINEDQIWEYRLPTKPRKKGERRKPNIELTVEAEALPANILRSMLEQCFEDLLPAGALREARIAEESERQILDILALNSSHFA